jgi:hypothetical protein
MSMGASFGFDPFLMQPEQAMMNNIAALLDASSGHNKKREDADDGPGQTRISRNRRRGDRNGRCAARVR